LSRHPVTLAPAEVLLTPVCWYYKLMDIEKAGTPMTQSSTLTVLEQTLWTIAQLSAPILLTALVIGLVISLIQAVTQINEQTLSFVPKIIGIALVLIIAGPWMLQTLLDFTARLFSSLPSLVN
jgi:flagellar biosynthesis protein FliQ